MSDTSSISESTYEQMLATLRADEEQRARVALEQASTIIRRFTALAAKHGVPLTPECFRYIQKIGVVAQASGLAKAMLTGVEADKDGLYAFDAIRHRLPGVRRREGCFEGTDYIVMAHPCFRRQMHPDNNWAKKFIELLWAFNEPEVDKFVAIDRDRIRIDIDGLDCFERDTWFGAPFNKNIEALPPGIVKLRPPLDLERMVIDLLFAQCHCLDIKWGDKGSIKTFQALELKTEDVQLELDGTKYFPARYLHAEFDTKAGVFRHFDGAIQYLLADEYHRRKEGDFNHTAKDQRHIKARSQKVFKINGALPTERWVELCCHFLPGNPLTFEYFTGSYPDHVEDAIAKVRLRSEQATDV